MKNTSDRCVYSPEKKVHGIFFSRIDFTAFDMYYISGKYTHWLNWYEINTKLRVFCVLVLADNSWHLSDEDLNKGKAKQINTHVKLYIWMHIIVFMCSAMLT